MQISPINHTTFNARIKMNKADTTKLMGGIATVAAGSAALYTGLDALDILPGNLAEGIYHTIKNKHVVETPEGGVYADNWKSANVASTALFASAPIGSSLLPYGSSSIKEAFNNQEDENKNLPD